MIVIFKTLIILTVLVLTKLFSFRHNNLITMLTIPAFSENKLHLQ